jgi:putative mRNA 3-end processing factor
VRLGDGVRIDLAGGATLVADASRPDGDVNVLTHAHGDHLYSSDGRAPGPLVCSPLTAALAEARRPDAGPVEAASDDRVDLLPAGHVAGSRAALVDDGERRTLYTGDCSTRDRAYLDGFEPVPADVLVVEATYGTPEYVFPPQEEVEAEITDWLAGTDAPVLLFGYALGRAGKLQRLAERAGRERVLVSDAIARLNRVVEAHLDVTFPDEPYEAGIELGPGDAVVLPSGTSNLGWVDALAERTGAAKAGFSGWAVDDSFRYANGYDATFPLSDHCDFRELEALVEAVDPAVVYTQHGAADAFAAHCTRELGYEAYALKRDQATLGEF